ncbi:dephospho-CoA kinase [Gracilinema caldarium]|uniref:Dephospho-CoA kinase n=1 Tax=Gracilinema caldarium (strain ATCC 51460 / DSM 7334 / H1) TaxID=744872 RepID=F8EYN6_GRAC1|nr:dephospho-CoA kinase [Gracilinema caldarium]AEJ18613.1 Dephospho-CoA kinase [Gracilinema caldarium DSM 7334]
MIIKPPLDNADEHSSEPILIGLTGPYCAGKNYVAALLERRGIPVLDVDKLGHLALEQEKDAIIGRFGTAILNPEGNIDRKALGAQVFSNPQDLADLEAIVHPRANQLTEAWILNQGDKKAVAINAALLHRSVVFPRLRCIIIVQAGLITRLIRGKQRDRLPLQELLKRFKSQKKFNAQYFQGNADTYTVKNRGVLGIFTRWYRSRLERRIDAILQREGIGH